MWGGGSLSTYGATFRGLRCFTDVRAMAKIVRGAFFRRTVLSGLVAWLSATVAYPEVAPGGTAGAEGGQVETDSVNNEVPDVPLKRDATSLNNPYRAIVARNAFRLREPAPPPPPPTNAPPPPDPVKIDVKLAGLAQIKGVRYAYLMVPDTERPGQFVYPSLTDNPEHGRVRHGSGLEVREIDIKKQTVRVVNGGMEVTLNFKDNGLKKDAVPGVAPGKPGPGGIPAPGAPGGNLNRAGNTTTVFPAGGGGPVPSPEAKPASSGEPLVFSRNANRASVPNGNPFTPNVGAVAGGNPGGMTGGGNTALPSRIQRIDSSAAAIPSVPIEHQYDILIKQRQAGATVGVQFPPIPGMPAQDVPVPQQ